MTGFVYAIPIYDFLVVLVLEMQITTALKIIENYTELTSSLRTSIGTWEAAADNPQSVNGSKKINYSYSHFTVFRIP